MTGGGVWIEPGNRGGEEQGWYPPPPPGIEGRVFSTCAACAWRQPVVQVTDWIGGVRFTREVSQTDSRCVDCPTRKNDPPRQFPADPPTNRRRRFRWLRRKGQNSE